MLDVILFLNREAMNNDAQDFIIGFIPIDRNDRARGAYAKGNSVVTLWGR